MSKIMTVCGPIAPEALGVTSMHEHILFDGVNPSRKVDPNERHSPWYSYEDPVSMENVGFITKNFIWNRDAQNLDDENVMGLEVQDFKDSGGEAILELSVEGTRYDIEGLRRISQRTGVNIVAATGFYVEGMWRTEAHRGQPVEYYHDFMINEIEHGITGTDVKPGHLKIAISTFSQDEENALRAAARVSAQTGLSLTVHPSSQVGGNTLDILNIALEEGVNPERFVMAHMGGTICPSNLRELLEYPELAAVNDLEPCHRILDLGANISFEFLSGEICMEMMGEVCTPDWKKLSALYQLLQEGYAEQIVLGTDLCVKTMAHRYGGEGYCRLTRFAAPTMKAVGVSELAIRQMLVKNPARILAY